MSELTSLIEGIEVGNQDVDVCQMLARSWHEPSDPVAKWQVAIKNQADIIYRVATLKSLDQMLSFLGGMSKLGMADELENALGKVDGFDAILAIRVVTQSHASSVQTDPLG